MGPESLNPRLPDLAVRRSIFYSNKRGAKYRRWVRSDFHGENRSSDLFLGIVLSLFANFGP